MTEKSIPSDELWINLLPSLGNKDLVKFGTSRTQTIQSLAAYSPRSLVLVKSQNDSLSALGVQYIELSSVPARSCDVFIADEPEFVGAYVSNHGATVFAEHVARIIKDNGIILIVFPGITFGTIKIRYGLLRALKRSCGLTLTYFFCAPSSSDIQWLASLKAVLQSERQEACLNLKQVFNRPSNVLVKSLAKALIHHATRVFYPRGGLLVIGKGKSSNEAAISITEELILSAGLATFPDDRTSSLNSIYRLATPRHWLFLRDSHTNELRCAGKLEKVCKNNIGMIEAEINNIQLANLCKDELALHKIQIPLVSYSRMVGQRHELLLSAVTGVSLELLVAEAKSQRGHGQLCEIINSVSEIQRVTQACLTTGIGKRVHNIAPFYFEDYLKLGLEGLCDDSRFVSRSVQHGDFTVNNIMFNPQSKDWGLIDWETMSSGYPALFDWFSFVTSLRLSDSGKQYVHDPEADYDSFIHTYFCENEFTECLRAQAAKWAQFLSLDPTNLHKCLTTSLLVICNRRRTSRSRADYQAMWEKSLMYAYKHRDLWRLTA